MDHQPGVMATAAVGLLLVPLAGLPSSAAAKAAPTVCHQYEESSGHCRDSHDPTTHLWPKPALATTTQQGPSATLTPDTLSIVASGGGPMLRAAAQRYHALVFAPVAPATRGSTADGAVAASATLRVTVRDAESTRAVATSLDESYELAVSTSGGGTLAANTTVGAIRGLETYAQLFEYSESGDASLHMLPIKIADRPRWKYRGIKIDTSRHFIDLPHLRNIVRAMEAAKMNVLQWHIIDGQSFPLESKLFPQLAEHGRYCASCTYSQAEIKGLVAFAKARGVRIIPELDMPGHSGFQYGMPEIVACPHDQSGAGSNRALDPTLNRTYEFLTEFLSEQAELFGDPVINVYGDEVRFPCWNSSATIASWMAAHGIAAGDFQALTEVFWRRFATEVAPEVFKRTGVAVMIGEADVWGTDGPPYELPQWLAQAVPGYPLPLTVEVWGGYTLDQNENGTLRKVLATDGMEAVVGGPYYLDQDLPRPFRPPTSAAAKREVFTAPYWVS